MIDNDKKQEFVELRAKGYSFDKISKSLSVSKPTLIKWQKEFGRDIENLKYAQMEELITKFNLMSEKRIEFFSELLNNSMQEIKKRNLENMKTKELFQMVLNLEQRVISELVKVNYKTGEFETEDFEISPFRSIEKVIPLQH